MSTISASTTSTTAYVVTADTTGALVLQTGATPTTAVTISSAQVVTLANALAVASGGTGVTTSTGSGAVVLGTSPTLTTPTINSAQIATVSGTASLYMARAWVNFNGTGTVAIRASGNVTSITDNGTGSYAVNFTTAIVDANYSISAISSTTTGNGASITTVRESGIGGSNPSTTSFQLSVRAPSFADLDVPYVYAQVFR
jgi:hypothetical protein